MVLGDEVRQRIQNMLYWTINDELGRCILTSNASSCFDWRRIKQLKRQGNILIHPCKY